MNQKFYLTTPIYYVNGRPHVGHAYTTIAADVLARYHRLLGQDVFFLAGTDENAQKNVIAAEQAGFGQNVAGYVAQMSAVWQKTWDEMALTPDDFIRTTEERHRLGVEKFWRAVQERGDIYKDVYEGWYCGGCEAFKSSDDLDDGLCPLHKKKAEWLKEENYFFRLTNYRDALLAHFDAHPEFIEPAVRRHEVRSYVERFMTDISVSRAAMRWGIPVPGDATQRVYVWFDALINYLTGVGYGTDEAKFKKFWPADLHLVGKDIIKFHCALWPAMLMSAGLPLPQRIFAHGYFTIDGEKISKSLGNVIDPIELAGQYGHDALRFYLLREMTFGQDGNFSRSRLTERYEKELAGELGNLIQRVLVMAHKYCAGRVPGAADGFLAGAWPAYRLAMEEIRPHDALQIVWRLVREANQFIERQAPWQLVKLNERKMLEDTIYVLLETIRHLAWMLWPILPKTAEEIFTQFRLPLAEELSSSVEERWVWGGLTPGHALGEPRPLFPRLDQSR